MCFERVPRQPAALPGPLTAAAMVIVPSIGQVRHRLRVPPSLAGCQRVCLLCLPERLDPSSCHAATPSLLHCLPTVQSESGGINGWRGWLGFGLSVASMVSTVMCAACWAGYSAAMHRLLSQPLTRPTHRAASPTSAHPRALFHPPTRPAAVTL